MQLSIIQKASQRLILVFSTIFPGFKLYLYNITQAYTQSKTGFNYQIFVRLPEEMKLQKGTILRIVKPLYSIPEASNYWFNIYYSYYIKELDMNQLTFDSYLLNTGAITNPGFGVVGLQTDDTIILANTTFATKKEIKFKKVYFLSKNKKQLTESYLFKFNKGNITFDLSGSILLT